MTPPVQEPAACRRFQYAYSRAIPVVIKSTLASEHRALNHDMQERRMMVTVHHAPGRSSRIFSRIPVSWIEKSMSSNLVYSRNISFGGLLSEMCYFLSGDDWCSLATLSFLLVSFPSSLTASQPWTLTLPLSPHDKAKPSKFVLVDYLNNG